jgi:multiple sugar transport system permease protein
MNMSNITRKMNKPQVAAFIFILPSLITIFLFWVIPLVASIAMSFMNVDLFFSRTDFVGIENYINMYHDSRFWNALYNTFRFMLMEMPLQISISLLLAVFISRNTPFSKFTRTVLYIPVICSLTAMGILWSLLLDPTLGYYAYLLKVVGFETVGFLKSTTWAMPAIAVMTVWKNFGLTMVILSAAMLSVPKSLYEAATLDGAGNVAQFFNVTLPLIVPALGFCVITNTIDSLKVFDQVYTMTQGGPLNSTETIVQYIYNRGFKIAPFNLGYASSIAVILFMIIIVISLVMYKYFIDKETV